MSGDGPPVTPGIHPGPNNITATSGDGYVVTINAANLDQAAKDMAGHQKSTVAMLGQVRDTLVPGPAFGTVPEGLLASKALATSFEDHLKAVQDMGMSLGVLGGRIQEAASLAFAVEPETRKAGSIAAPNGMAVPTTPPAGH